jgi:hypothetical protein
LRELGVTGGLEEVDLEGAPGLGLDPQRLHGASGVAVALEAQARRRGVEGLEGGLHLGEPGGGVLREGNTGELLQQLAKGLAAGEERPELGEQELLVDDLVEKAAQLLRRRVAHQPLQVT